MSNPSSSAAGDGLRLPPHSIEAEQAVLGGLMIDPAAWDQIADRVMAEDFYRNDHRLIFAATAGLIERNQPCDAVTLSGHLESQGVLDQVGGLAYLGTLARDTPTAANIRAYAEIVRERSVLRQLISAGNAIVGSALEPEGREAREIVDDAERAVFEIAERGSRGKVGFRPVKAILPEVVTRIDELYHAEGKLTGIATGFKQLDEMTSGLQPGDLIIVAGRPSMGKTTLAVNMAENAALGAGKSVAIFSMEMSAESLTLRMLSSLGRINQSHLRSGRLEEEDWPRIDSAMTQLGGANIHVDETPALTPTEVRARARRLKRERGLDLIVVDYLQLMQVAGNKENRATEISEISRSLKALAKELKVPVIALSQLNRSVEQRVEKKPVMSDLRECVTGDTLVCLADGRRVPIRKLVGQTPDVLSMTPDGRITRAASEKIWCAGKKPIRELTLASGRRLRATGKHRLYGSSGWQRLSDLAPGDRLALARTLPEPVSVEKWPDERVALLALRMKRYARGADRHRLPRPTNGRPRPAAIHSWVRELGISGQRPAGKRIPDGVFRLGDAQIKLFLRHLWATEGAISARKPGRRASHSLHFSSRSRGLAEDVAALLLRIGIVARIQAVTSGYRSPVYMVWILGAEAQMRFLDSVGAFGPRARSAQVLTANARRPWTTRFEDAELLEEAQPRAVPSSDTSAASSDIFWDRVLRVDVVGEEEVFDLTVPGTACWLADGIVSHNSGAIEQDSDLILLIYREEVYDPNTTRKGIADIIVAKQRNGPTGEVQLTFLGQYTKFENYAPESYAEGVFR